MRCFLLYLYILFSHWLNREPTVVSQELTILSCFNFLFNFLILERETKGERERNIDLLFHLLMHSLGDSRRALTRDRTHNLGMSRQCSNQRGYQARARILCLKTDKILPWQLLNLLSLYHILHLEKKVFKSQDIFYN